MAVKTTYDNLEYHLRQYENVYRSTEMMVDWLEDIGGVRDNTYVIWHVVVEQT